MLRISVSSWNRMSLSSRNRWIGIVKLMNNWVRSMRKQSAISKKNCKKWQIKIKYLSAGQFRQKPSFLVRNSCSRDTKCRHRGISSRAIKSRLEGRRHSTRSKIALRNLKETAKRKQRGKARKNHRNIRNQWEKQSLNRSLTKSSLFPTTKG